MKNKYNVPFVVKQQILKRDNFTCQKCGFKNLTAEELEIHHINLRVSGGDHNTDNLIVLCCICHHYAPDSEEEFIDYIQEKIDGSVLNTFRKTKKSIAKITKRGMINLFNKGILVTRAPRGYKIVNKELLPTENSYIVQEIYQTYLNNDISLTQLAKKYHLSVNGLKKVLSNQTYLGKIKFAGQISQGKHMPLISQELFDKVQEKLAKLKRTYFSHFS